MSFVRKALSTAKSSLYDVVTPATLSGAVDVIVVARTDDEGEVQLACSPFHVRFGKLSVWAPVDRKVRVKVNGEMVPLSMKVTETGEAFFVFETNEADVPADLLTSPLAEAVSDSDVASGRVPSELKGIGTTNDVEPLELGPAETANPPTSFQSSIDAKREDSADPTKMLEERTTTEEPESLDETSAMERSDSAAAGSEEPSAGRANSELVDETPFGAHDLPPEETSDKVGTTTVQSGLLDAAARVATAGRAALTSVTTSGQKLRSRHRHADSDESQRTGASAEVGELEEQMKAALEGQNPPVDQGGVIDPDPRPDEAGDDVRRARRRESRSTMNDDSPAPPRSEEEVAHFSTGPHMGDADPSDQTGPAPSVLPAPKLSGGGELILDTGGYKMTEQDVANAKETEEALLSEEFGAKRPSEGGPADSNTLLALTEALLRATEQLRSMAPNGGDAATATTPPGTRPSSPDPSSPRQAARATSPAPSVTSFRPSSPTPSTVNADLQSAALITSPTPHQFMLKADNETHIFELSLCNGGDFGNNRIVDEERFREHQVSFEQLQEQTDLVNNRNIVMRYDHRYLTWDNASPALASLGIYQQAVAQVKAAPAPAPAASRSYWTRWWSRSRTDSVTDATPSSVETAPPPYSQRETSPQPDSAKSDQFDLEAATPRVYATSDVTSAPGSPTVKPVTTVEADGVKRHYVKTLRLTSDQLKLLNLKSGVNNISYTVPAYTGIAKCTARIFLWEADYQVVISDIDGTITKSDALGHVFAMLGQDWTHLGVAKLFTDISRNGYKIMYLTSRAIGQADSTREYLKGIHQHSYHLPDGPVIMSPDRLFVSLKRCVVADFIVPSVVLRKPEVFKMACLQDIQRLFNTRNPFYAGFGNRITDALSYRSVDVPSSRIFTIDAKGDVKMELLELAGYKSSYIAMTDLVDQMFPPINRKSAPEYTDFNYWRAPLPSVDLPDLAPPSPALSARSDSSTARGALRRLSNLSISRRTSRTPLIGADAGRAASPRPTSPLAQATVLDDVDELEAGTLGETAFSSSPPTSIHDEIMPGALDRDERGEGEGQGDEDDDVPAAMDLEDDLDFSSIPY